MAFGVKKRSLKLQDKPGAQCGADKKTKGRLCQGHGCFCPYLSKDNPFNVTKQHFKLSVWCQ